MNKHILRCVALLLVPGLIADPALGALSPFTSKASFHVQNLSALTAIHQQAIPGALREIIPSILRQSGVDERKQEAAHYRTARAAGRFFSAVPLGLSMGGLIGYGQLIRDSISRYYGRPGLLFVGLMGLGWPWLSWTLRQSKSVSSDVFLIGLLVTGAGWAALPHPLVYSREALFMPILSGTFYGVLMYGIYSIAELQWNPVRYSPYPELRRRGRNALMVEAVILSLIFWPVSHRPIKPELVTKPMVATAQPPIEAPIWKPGLGGDITLAPQPQQQPQAAVQTPAAPEVQTYTVPTRPVPSEPTTAATPPAIKNVPVKLDSPVTLTQISSQGQKIYQSPLLDLSDVKAITVNVPADAPPLQFAIQVAGRAKPYGLTNFVMDPGQYTVQLNGSWKSATFQVIAPRLSPDLMITISGAPPSVAQVTHPSFMEWLWQRISPNLHAQESSTAVQPGSATTPPGMFSISNTVQFKGVGSVKSGLLTPTLLLDGSPGRMVIVVEPGREPLSTIWVNFKGAHTQAMKVTLGPDGKPKLFEGTLANSITKPFSGEAGQILLNFSLPWLDSFIDAEVTASPSSKVTATISSDPHPLKEPVLYKPKSDLFDGRSVQSIGISPVKLNAQTQAPGIPQGFRPLLGRRSVADTVLATLCIQELDKPIVWDPKDDLFIQFPQAYARKQVGFRAGNPDESSFSAIDLVMAGLAQYVVQHSYTIGNDGVLIIPAQDLDGGPFGSFQIYSGNYGQSQAGESQKGIVWIRIGFVPAATRAARHQEAKNLVSDTIIRIVIDQNATVTLSRPLPTESNSVVRPERSSGWARLLHDLNPIATLSGQTQTQPSGLDEADEPELVAPHKTVLGLIASAVFIVGLGLGGRWLGKVARRMINSSKMLSLLAAIGLAVGAPATRVNVLHASA